MSGKEKKDEGSGEKLMDAVMCKGSLRSSDSKCAFPQAHSASSVCAHVALQRGARWNGQCARRKPQQSGDRRTTAVDCMNM